MIRIRILGSAAGGGLPQWNCSCPNCRAARAGKIPARTQSSVAVSGDHQQWLLINASPDLAAQVESFPLLQPGADTARNSPLVAVCLSNADIDHALGLLLLRQRDEPLIVYAAHQTRERLSWIDAALDHFYPIHWRTFAPRIEKLDCLKRSSLRPIDLGNSVAFELRDESSGQTVLIAPAVDEMSADLHDAIDRAEMILFDGTFWSDEELRAFRQGARSAREMNHLPISDGSFDLLRAAPARRKIYMHINNTNPILMPGSPERLQLERAGIEVGYDGLELTL